MGIKNELFCFVALAVISSSAQWNNYQGNLQRSSQKGWYQHPQSQQASQGWQGYKSQHHGNKITADRSQQSTQQRSSASIQSDAFSNRAHPAHSNSRAHVSNPHYSPVVGQQDIAGQPVLATQPRMSYQMDHNSATLNQRRNKPVVSTTSHLHSLQVPSSRNNGGTNTFHVTSNKVTNHNPPIHNINNNNNNINNDEHVDQQVYKNNQNSYTNNSPYPQNIPDNAQFVSSHSNHLLQDSGDGFIADNNNPATNNQNTQTQNQYRIYQHPKNIQKHLQTPNPTPNQVEHIVAAHPELSQGSRQSTLLGSYPAQVHVSGDPDTDQSVAVKVSTPEQTYHVELQRINNNILHEDVRFLTVSVDKNGKTVFQEQFKPIDLQKKARSLNYYQDLRSGTFLSIHAHRKGSGQKPESYIEGVLFDELIVAAPKSKKRHKRALFPNTHTVYRDKGGKHSPFHFDSLDVPVIPGYEDMLKMQYNVTKDDDSKSETHSRPKRQTSPRIEPELLLFVDFALYREFEGDSNELLEYLMHFWHAVNWKYLTIALSGTWPIIDLRIREIGVFKEPNAQPFIESSRIRRGSKMFSLYDAMDSLQKWLIRYENALPVHDVAFLQTGENACRRVRHDKEGRLPFSPNILKSLRQGIPSKMDPKEEKDCVTGTAGVAYVRGACLSAPMLRGNAFNFGIGEASNSFNGVIIAAHEVGHLLGAYHDGEADAGVCSSKSGYIMSYTRDDSYKFSRFSECSVRSFQNFLRMDRAKCLLQRSSRDTLKFPTTFPGKFMTLRQQCLRFTGGPPCEEGPTQCEHLCCDDRKGEWRYTRSEPAVDGTECSHLKVCLNGQCVPLSSIGR